MTRENKLVMVIGFGLLLFVGILVSDHLSARDAQIANPATIVSYEEKDLPGADELREQARIEEFGAMPERAPSEPAQVDGRAVVLQPLDRSGAGPSGFEPPIIQPEPRITVPTERTHTVVKGDHPERLAQKYYGKRSLANKLAEYNGIDATKMRIGQVIKVPDISVLDPNAAPQNLSIPAPGQQLVQDEAPRQPESVVEAPAKAPAKTVREEPKFKTATVQKGDNLWKLATRAYGKGTNANVEKIRGLNPGLNEKNLKVGSQIRIAAIN